MNDFSDLQHQLDEAIKQSTEVYNSINNYAIEIGVVSGNTNRKHTVDITNAELMYIHENGSPLNNIPARPVLQITINKALKTLVPETLDRIFDGCFSKGWTKEDVKQELEKLCIRLQSITRKIIYQSNELAPNAPSTIKSKGSDRPLLDTGQLARSITCRLINK